MNSSGAQKTTFRKKGEQTATSGIEQSDTAIHRIVFVDDEPDFLRSMEINAVDVGVAVRTYQMSDVNGLGHWLTELADTGWRPDALVMDLNIATGAGGSGLDYLTTLRQDEGYLILPIVVTTKADFSDAIALQHPSEALKRGADAYVPGKTAAAAFLKQICNQLPFWQTQARARVWHELLKRTAADLNRARVEADVKTALDKCFQFMATHLGIPHAFVRERVWKINRYPMWTHYGGWWLSNSVTDTLEDLPPVQKCIETGGQVFGMDNMTLAFAGQSSVNLVGKHMRGCALMLAGEPVGVMTVVRDHEHPFPPQDDVFIERLAGQIGTVMGHRRLHAHHERLQAALLEFGQKVAQAESEQAICQALADVAHTSLHGDDVLVQAKCTVRLVAPGEPVLRRYGEAGRVLPKGDIPIDRREHTPPSVYREAVLTAKPIRCDTSAAFTASGYLDNNCRDDGTCEFGAQSAYCVPLTLRRPDDKPGAFGAMNLEHTKPYFYADAATRAFVQGLAQTAGLNLRRLRSQRFVSRLLAWSVRAYDQPQDDLWREVHDTLFEFCGHSVLLQMAPPLNWAGDVNLPWRVRRVFALQQSIVDIDPARWQAYFGSAQATGNWSNTYTKKCPDEAPRSKEDLFFTADEDVFLQSKELMGEHEVTARAVVALRTELGEVNGLLVLLWFHPPAIAKEEFDGVLKHFARYCAQLVQHGEQWADSTARLQRAEAENIYAFAARQFEHVLNNKLATLIADVELAQRGVSADLPTTLAHIGQGLAGIDRRARKMALYMRTPQPRVLKLPDLWRDLRLELRDRAKQLTVDVADWPAEAAQASVWADYEVLWNVLYVMLDNALQALTGQAGDRRIEVSWRQDGEQGFIRVQDNGPGIPAGLEGRLGDEFGLSSKPDGQGVALPLAKRRLQSMRGDLSLMTGLAVGAAFEIRLPLQSKLIARNPQQLG